MLPLNYETVYRVTLRIDGAAPKSPPYIAVGIHGSEIPEGVIFYGKTNAIAKDDFTVKGRVIHSSANRVEVEQTDVGVGGHVLVFEPLTREMFLEMPDILGFDSLKDDLSTSGDVQNYFRVSLLGDDDEAPPGSVPPPGSIPETVEEPTELDLVVEGISSVAEDESPVLVLALGRYSFRAALFDDADSFVLMDEVSSVFLDAAMKKRVNIVFHCGGHNLKWYREALLEPLHEKGYHSVLVMLHDPETTPKQMAENFVTLTAEVDDFCLFAPGDPPRRVWVRAGARGPERISDPEFVDSFREDAGVDWMDYLAQSVNERRADHPLNTDLDAVLALCQEAIRRR
jgi:hypothetical protein